MQLKQSGGILHFKVVAQDEHLSGVVVSKAKKRSPSQAIQMEKERWILFLLMQGPCQKPH